MSSKKEIRRAAQRLFKVCMVNGRMDEARVRDLMRELEEKKPRGWLALLGVIYHLVRQELERRTAIVESSADLSGEDRDRIVGELRRGHGEDVSVEFRAVPELIGGSRIRIGSDVWDGSIRTRLERLRASFT